MDSHGPVDTQLLNLELDDFPFGTALSLEALAGYWQRAAAEPDPVRAAMARTIVEGLARAPELAAPVVEAAVLERHRPLVDAMMSAIFPPAFWAQDIGAALVPFRLHRVYATPAFDGLLAGEDGRLRARLSVDRAELQSMRLLYAYAAVLGRFYGIELPVDVPLTVTARDPETGLDRHFKTSFDGSFLIVEAPDGVPPLPESAACRACEGLADPARLLELLPPERFRFRGFTVFRAVDVTDQEVLSGLKRDLIDRESIISSAAFQRLERRLQALFRRPSLGFALAALQGEDVLLLNSSAQIAHGCIFADSSHHRQAEFAGSIFARAVSTGRPVIVEDLATLRDPHPIERGMLERGIRSVIVAPLLYQDRVIGTLGLRSTVPDDLDGTLLPRVRELTPLFSMAVKRSVDELDTRIQAVIKEQCTAIHPVVEWRFRQAVMRMIERRATGGQAELEPVVFEGVYPLYALSDIRGSSVERNRAIQADLVVHLGRTLELVRAAHRERDLPILDALAHRVGQELERIEQGLRSGDEPGVLAFIRKEVDPVLAYLEGAEPRLRERIAAYRARLDPRLGTVYERRRAFDESVTAINDAVGALLDAEESRAQAMFPHYFEKQKTDGVEWSLYVGGALLEHGGFDPLHLKNLRLWQLMVLASVARRTHALRASLPVPLDTTHLVLVHHAPIAIRFRQDEKRFDVDGAYNVRYEVIKKRIDKALIEGTAERLTQPGKIAIVYAQPREAAEYREYIDYLQARGLLLPGVEELSLDALQGVDGLRALRVAVDLEAREVGLRPEPGAFPTAGAPRR